MMELNRLTYIIIVCLLVPIMQSTNTTTTIEVINLNVIPETLISNLNIA